MVAQGQTKGKAVERFGVVCPPDPLSLFIKINPLGWEMADCLET